MNEQEEYRREFRGYVAGLTVALVLTGLAFANVAFQLSAGEAALAVLYGLAFVQIIAHFRFFLHIDLKRSRREDLQLLLFSAMIIAAMAGGTLVILFNLASRM